ncbi:MAG: hypothetical protein HYX78_10815 [Armatimonadetes bacterium]|nr:hypothetical protein [Armatimonadota bacterium]
MKLTNKKIIKPMLTMLLIPSAISPSFAYHSIDYRSYNKESTTQIREVYRIKKKGGGEIRFFSVKTSRGIEHVRIETK